MKHTPILGFQRPAVAERMIDPADPVLVERARHELAFAELRRRRLPGRRVGDIDWLVLLELFVAHADGRELLTKDLAASTAPATTLIRYCDALEQDGLIARSERPGDRRATIIAATPKSIAQVAAILAQDRRDAQALSAAPPSRAGSAR